jgi:hypothetical protein
MEVGFIFWRCRWYVEKPLFSSASFGGFGLSNGPRQCRNVTRPQASTRAVGKALAHSRRRVFSLLYARSSERPYPPAAPRRASAAKQ